MQEFGPRVGAAIFVVREDGKFIFQKRQGSHGSGSWSTPGGHVEFGEDPMETCRRETLEETGCSVHDIAFVTMTNDFFPDDNKHYVTLWYVGRWDGNEPRILEPEKCTEQRWVAPDALPRPTFLAYDNLTSEQRHFISKAITEKAKKQ